jgi:magnesium transporter
VQVCIVDDTGFPKKGKHSVGVARQHSGTLGKVDNCQVAVSLHWATAQASFPMDWSLYLPVKRVQPAHGHDKNEPELPMVGLLIQKTEDSKAPSKFFLSNLDQDTPLVKLAKMAKMRWRIEMDYHILKGEIGLDHYEGRTWQGWYRPLYHGLSFSLPRTAARRFFLRDQPCLKSDDYSKELCSTKEDGARLAKDSSPSNLKNENHSPNRVVLGNTIETSVTPQGTRTIRNRERIEVNFLRIWPLKGGSFGLATVTACEATMYRKRHAAPGASPGTMVMDPAFPKPVIRIISYGLERLEEKEVQTLQDLRQLMGRDAVTWVDVQGLGDEAVLREVGDLFEIHPLALSDVVNLPQRPKVEVYDKHLFILARRVSIGSLQRVTGEQVSLFLGKDYVLTFHERASEYLEPVRERLRKDKGRIRKNGADYLAYAIADTVIDGYFPVLEIFGEALERLEDEVVMHPNPRSIERIHRTKRELITLRRTIWPLRDAISSLLRESGDYVKDKTAVYLRDSYDHVVQLMDIVETYRDVTSSLHDVYLSSVSNRMNEIMKVLTVVGTIFIPLTFFAGVYGMNFRYMPELEWPFGYYLFWGIMLIIALGMVYYFRRLGWLGGKRIRNPKSRL